MVGRNIAGGHDFNRAAKYGSTIEEGGASRPLLFAQQIHSHGFMRINTDKALSLS
jgi:hypothetical protein